MGSNGFRIWAAALVLAGTAAALLNNVARRASRRVGSKGLIVCPSRLWVSPESPGGKPILPRPERVTKTAPKNGKIGSYARQ